MLKTYDQVAAKIAETLSDGWGKSEEQNAAKTIAPILEAFQSEIESECMKLFHEKRVECDRLAGEVNALARALTVAMRYFRGPFVSEQQGE